MFLLRKEDSKLFVRENFTNTFCDYVSLSVVHYKRFCELVFVLMM